jgi:tetratricopeptide (TPR) repeat protein
VNPLVSAAMIVRDEAGVLDECLASLAGQVDEIVIVDTGSVDDTLAIAARHGARILHHPWNDDFSEPRNIALDAATGAWILYIDADERLRPPGGGLRSAVSDPGLVAVKLRLQPRHGFTSYLEYRLFRRDKRIRFAGRIHEQIGPSIRSVAASDGLAVGASDIQILHVGYEGDLSHKHGRNLPLLRRAVEEMPGRIFCWCHLGETLAALGRTDEAEAALLTAIRLGSGCAVPSDRAEASLACQQLARIRLAAGIDCRAFIEEGLANVPGDHALRLLLARALIDAGEDEQALAELRILTAVDAQTYFDPLMAFDRAVFGELAWDLAGLAAFRLGRYQDASLAYDRAYAATGNLAYRLKAETARARDRHARIEPAHA